MSEIVSVEVKSFYEEKFIGKDAPKELPVLPNTTETPWSEITIKDFLNGASVDIPRPKIRIIYEGMYNWHSANYLTQSALKMIDAFGINSLVAYYGLMTKVVIGDSKEYLTSIFSYENVKSIELGNSVMLLSPTGSGKTKALEAVCQAAIADKITVVLLSNRTACVYQIKQDFIEDLIKDDTGDVEIPSALLDHCHFDFKIMTYHSFLQCQDQFTGKEMLLILDEIHWLYEDADFSNCPERMKRFIIKNIANTRRIYVTATPNEVIKTIGEIERGSTEHKPVPVNLDMPLGKVNELLNASSRIQAIYKMNTDYEYMDFMYYDPRDSEMLCRYICNVINQTSEKNGVSLKKKAVAFFNSKKRGEEISEKLMNLSLSVNQISSDDKEKVNKLAAKAKFDEDVLITTKVAENGVSLHDNSLCIIIAESYETVAIQQIIGRIRVDRKRPRKIIVLIPDYSKSDLGKRLSTLLAKKAEYDYSVENKVRAMTNDERVHVFYDIESDYNIGINEMEGLKIITELDYVKALLKEEHAHPFVRHILSLYGKEDEFDDSMYIGWDEDQAFKEKIHELWETYGGDEASEDNIKALKSKVFEICRNTPGKENLCSSSDMKINTLVDILRACEIDIKQFSSEKRFMFDIQQEKCNV